VIFLTIEDVEYFEAIDPSDPLYRQRCIVCLESFMGNYEENSKPLGCPYNHTKKENCKECAIPRAKERTVIRKLRSSGELKPLSKIQNTN